MTIAMRKDNDRAKKPSYYPRLSSRTFHASFSNENSRHLFPHVAKRKVYPSCLLMRNSSTTNKTTSCMLRVILSTQPRIPSGLKCFERAS